jgi:transketolase
MLNTKILSQAANEARGLAMDAIHACSSGHLGLPLGCAEIGAVLYGHALRHHPAAPRWLNRDRFVLSAGHGSMFLYGWLHLSGYDLPLEQVKNFRQLGSITPGHPESFMTPGVECTTGPLGQGVGNSVGMALAGKMTAAKFGADLFDYRVVCLAGDGCLQEGIAAEASAFAGHFKLDNLILIYDANDITLDAPAEKTQSEDTAKRYEAYGWDVQTVDGHDMEAFLKVFEQARSAKSGRPQLIVAKTEAGRGIPEVAGTYKAHGEAGAKFIKESRQKLGLPEEHFHVSEETRKFFAERSKALAAEHARWQERFSAWQKANPELAKVLAGGELDARELLKAIPEFPADAKLATRVAGYEVLQPLAKAVPNFISGSADLHGSTRNYIDSDKDFGPDNWTGRNIRFGIREHGMAAICNGVAYDGVFRASCATFMVFSDYCRPSMRLAALSHLPVVYIFTHDSVGVGEDGPTHQPVETYSSLRLIPNLDVIRPADPEETAGAFAAAVARNDGPTLLSLSRQNLPLLAEIPVKERREGVLRGAYVAKREQGELKGILLASGSELQHALAAAKQLGDGVRVVSVPSMEIFDRQPADYRESVLPAACRKRISMEAGVTAVWQKYIGLDGRALGIDRFGISAPGNTVMKELGITADHIVAAARELGL